MFYFSSTFWSPTHKYSVSITVSEPAGSAAALTAAGPKKPTSTKTSPCSSATALDQLNFTLKYDAGKSVASTDSQRGIYVIFNKPDLATGGYVALVKKPLLSPAPFFVASDTAAATVKTNTYIASADNLSVAQSEVLLGGNLRLEGLPTGLWSVTAIIRHGGWCCCQLRRSSHMGCLGCGHICTRQTLDGRRQYDLLLVNTSGPPHTIHRVCRLS